MSSPSILPLSRRCRNAALPPRVVRMHTASPPSHKFRLNNLLSCGSSRSPEVEIALDTPANVSLAGSQANATHGPVILSLVADPHRHCVPSPRAVEKRLSHDVITYLDYFAEYQKTDRCVIERSGGSVLIEWDLTTSHKSDMTSPTGRTWKTGTWQFMSISLLKKRKDKTNNQTERDDYESFLWVLLYNVLRYRPTVVKGPSLQELVYDIFDSRNVDFTGGDYKLSFLYGRAFSEEQIEDSRLPAPLRNILQALREMFQPLYPSRRRDRLGPDQLKVLVEAEARTSTSASLEEIFKGNLKLEWPSDDNAIDQILRNARSTKLLRR